MNPTTILEKSYTISQNMVLCPVLLLLMITPSNLQVSVFQAF